MKFIIKIVLDYKIMGIKHFFTWFKKRFTAYIYQLKHNETFYDKNISIDNLLIDMNGLFHNSAQKIYEYGNFKPKERLLGNRKPINIYEKQTDVFRDICDSIDKIFKLTKPKKRIVLCVDGPAPLSKQNQQRQRRFVSAKDNHGGFDSNSITPGTKFMDYLSKYIDWFIRKKISEDETWKNIEVIFSNEKVPGEGEHKLINFIRKYGKRESFCINSMDADLIMLCLGLQNPNIWILRDDLTSYEYHYYVLDMLNIKKELVDIMKWDDSKSERKFYRDAVINDFILMCFTVGNDFLPNIPGIEIIQGAIEFMFDVYKTTCCVYGHLTKKTRNGLSFDRKSLSCFLGTVSQYEKGVFEEKLGRLDTYFPDPLLTQSSKIVDGKYEIDIEKYRNCYYKSKFSELDIQKICHKYLEGMSWVLTYYTKEVPDWKWRYPYHYAPFCFDISKHIKTFKLEEFKESRPTEPFVQLLSVLPPKSMRLLPKPLDYILTTQMTEFCPENFKIDLSGKRHEWEGTVLLPMIDYEKITKLISDNKDGISEIDMKRNKLGKTFSYSKSENSSIFKSYYGDINRCFVNIKTIEI